VTNTMISYRFALASGECGTKEYEREAGPRRLLASTCFFVSRTRTPPDLELDSYGVHPSTDRRGAAAAGKRSIKSGFHLPSLSEDTAASRIPKTTTINK
jgi:hypothetical protein